MSGVKYDALMGGIREDDGSGGSGGGIPEAPIDGTGYVRKNAAWSPETSGSFATKLTSVSKTANYSANPGELVSCDVSGGSFTVTMPSAPADKSVIHVKLNQIGTNKYLTLACSGTDKFNTSTGNTQIFMYLFGEYAQCQYDAATGLWYTFISAGTFNFATNFPGIDATTPITADDISIDYSTRILTITPPLGYFNIFVDGNGIITRYRKVGNISFPAFTDTSGVWYFYFDVNGTAVTTQTPWNNFSTTVPVYRLCWNATLSGSAKSVKELIETHVNDVSAAEHAWMHKYGSIWFSGLDIANNALPSGAPNADGRNAVVALSTGKIIDDNLPYTITNSTGGGNWEQDLGNTTPASLNATNSALFKCFTQDAGGLVSFIDATRFPFLYNASNTPQYVTSTGTRSDVSNLYFTAYFIFACQDPRNGNSVSIVSAPAEYSTITNAQAISWSDIVSIYSNLGEGAEVRPLYKLIIEYRSSYDVGTKKTVIRQVDDIRKAVVTQSTSAIGSVLASSVVTVPSSEVPESNAQSAIDGLGVRKLNLSGGYMTGALNEAKGADIASSNSISLGGATGNFVDITGTTQINSMGSYAAGTKRIVRFTGSLVLQHSAISQILPTGANITTAAGDTATFISLGSGYWICTQYQRANGTALASSGSGAQMVVTLADYQGPAVYGPIGKFTAPYGMTLAEVTPVCDAPLPVGSNLVFELRLNGSAGSNILSSTCQVTTTESLTNGQYVGTPVTSFTSGSIADGANLTAFVTSYGSTSPAMNPRLILRFSA